METTDLVKVPLAQWSEVRWAVGWLAGLIEDERVDDLYPDDEYVERIRRLDTALNGS